MPIDNRVASMFASVANAAQNLSPDTGEGVQGEWPPEGDHECYVTDVNAEEAIFKAADSTEHAGLAVRFKYLTVSPLPGRESPEPLEWEGAAIRFPLNIGALRDPPGKGSRFRAEKELSRLLGFLQVILGRPEKNITAGLQEVSSKVATTKVACLIRCEYRKGKSKTPLPGVTPDPSAKTPEYKTDYCVQNLTK